MKVVEAEELPIKIVPKDRRKKIRRSNFWDKFQPADLIATMIVIGYIALTWKGFSTMLSAAFNIIIGVYFGTKISRHLDK